MTDEVLFENLDYGVYYLNSIEGSYYNEAFRYGKTDFNKLYANQVRLPDGKGNIIYLLTDTFDSALSMIANKKFVSPPSYRRFYYPWIVSRRFMGRRLFFNVKKESSSRSKEIKSRTTTKPVATKTIPNTGENVFFCLSDIYSKAQPIMNKFSAKINYTSFWKELNSILSEYTPEPLDKYKGNDDNHRIMIIDSDRFAFSQDSSLKDNKTNPLYLMYLAYMRTRSLATLQVDMDMLVYSSRMFMKFNPAKITDASQWNKFKIALFRIMNANLDDYTKSLSKEEQEEIDPTSKDITISSIVKDTVAPYTKLSSPNVKVTVANAVENKLKEKISKIDKIDDEIKDTQKQISGRSFTPDKKKDDNIFTKNLDKPITRINPASDNITDKQKRLFKAISGYEPLQQRTSIMIDDDQDNDIDEEDDLITKEELEDEEDAISNGAEDVLLNDDEVKEEILDEIQSNNAPKKDNKIISANSERDQKLREEQKKVVVKNSTVEEILSMDTTRVPIQTSDKSKVMHTSNKNMTTTKFANFEKTYLDELYVPQLVECFDMLKDKENSFYITNIDIKDSSDSLNLKETWTVTITNNEKKKYNMKVDIPKFQDNRFMYINGTKWIILKQNFYNPLVKDTPDTVIVTTNYNKVTVTRVATKSLSSIERVLSLMKKSATANMFTSGDSTKGNMKYISTIEYDELSKRIFKFKNNDCELYFSRDYINDNLSDQIPKEIKGNEFFIGTDGKIPILMNEDTGLDRNGRTIVDIIVENLSDEDQKLFNSIKGSKQAMYVQAKMAGQEVPIVVIFMIWQGLSKTLDRMNISWKFHPDMKRAPQDTSAIKYIRFSNGILEYQAQTFAELILNGLKKVKPERFTFEQFDTEESYDDFIFSEYGTYKIISEIKCFYEFLVDPITKKVCKDTNLPDDSVGLMIHAVKLLSDNKYVSKACDNSYRLRSIEMIPAILYSCIANQYKAHVNSGGRIPMTLKQNCVISTLIKEKTVEAYSTLNPVVEVSKVSTISTKGYKGSNSDYSYDKEKRSYDPSAVGKLAISTSADANVGVNRSLVVEPTITNAMGYRDPVDDIDSLQDINIFSPVELLTPGTARNDDPIRTSIN